MSTITWTESIKGADDFELGIPRTSPLVYHCTAPASKKADGLVFLIPDFNDDVDGEAFARLREHFAQTYGLLAVSVEYHCYRSRLKDGAKLEVSSEEFSALSQLCNSHGVALLDRQAMMYALKQLPKYYEFEFRVTPLREEYQNLGVMQALDHLLVMQHLQESDRIEFNTANVIALGAGYAGYLALLLAKLAPNTLRAVLEYSDGVSPGASYLFGAKVSGEAPYYYHVGKIRIAPIISTHWSQDEMSPNFFSESRRHIRDVALEPHVQTMAAASVKRRCQYRCHTSLSPDMLEYEEKQRQVGMYVDAGFDAQLFHMTAPSVEEQALAEYQANRLRIIFDQHYSTLAVSEGVPDALLGTSLAYLCDDTIYAFEHGGWGCLPNVMKF